MSLRSKGGSFLGLLAELILVALGVFLALLANDWHEEQEHRALAKSALRNFAEEMRSNQRNIQEGRGYHEKLAGELRQFLRSPPPLTQEQFDKTVHFTGVHPVTFEHTAWDLALATQALRYLKPEVAFAISKVYTQQSSFQTLQNNFLASAYTILANPDVTASASATLMYLSDVNVQEPMLLEIYVKVFPEVEKAERTPSGSAFDWFKSQFAKPSQK